MTDFCSDFCPFVGCETCEFGGGEPASATTGLPVDNSPEPLSSTVSTLSPMTHPNRLDGCPECMTRDNAPRLIEDADHGVICHYRCAACGCTWSTSWWGDDA